jgi:hypothetical protein
LKAAPQAFKLRMAGADAAGIDQPAIIVGEQQRSE